MSQPKAILLDFDGTLLEVSHMMREAMGRTFEAYGKRRWTDDEALEYEGVSEIIIFPEIFGDRAAAAKQTFYDKYDEVEAERELELKPGAEQFIKYAHQLRENGRVEHLGIITNKPASLVKDELARLNIDEGIFDAIIGREDVSKTKPDPESYYKAIGERKISPKEALYIGDTKGDKDFAENVGMKFIGVGDGFPQGALKEGELACGYESGAGKTTTCLFN